MSAPSTPAARARAPIPRVFEHKGSFCSGLCHGAMSASCPREARCSWVVALVVVSGRPTPPEVGEGSDSPMPVSGEGDIWKKMDFLSPVPTGLPPPILSAIGGLSVGDAFEAKCVGIIDLLGSATGVLPPLVAHSQVPASPTSGRLRRCFLDEWGRASQVHHDVDSVLECPRVVITVPYSHRPVYGWLRDDRRTLKD